MAVPIAELFVVIGADISGALNGINQVDGRVKGLTQSFRDAAPAGKVLAAAGAAIGVGLLSSVKTAADFGEAMSGVKAVMSTDDVKKFSGDLDRLALSLGAETAFTSREAAAGLEELIKAGVPAEAVLAGAGRAALDLAAATGTDVATAATVASQAMNAFKVPVSELPTIVDRLAGVVNVSAADMGDLRLGMQQVSPVAAGLGLSFSDTASALGIFANYGLRGSDAGTSLKTMLLNLQPSTKKQTELFRQLGIITASGANQFFDASGQAKDFVGIAGVLRQSLRGMTDQQRLATLETLFGTDAIRAANILYSAGSDEIAAFNAQVAGVSAAAQAAERLNNLNGDVRQLAGAFETVQIQIGRYFEPGLRAIVQRATGVIRAVVQMSDGSKAFVVALVTIGGAIAFALGSFVLLAPFLASLPAAFGTLGLIVGALAPVFILLAAVVAGFVLLWQRNMFGIRDITASVIEGIKPIIETLGNAFLAVLGGDFEAAANLAGDAIKKLTDHFDGVGNRIGSVIDPIGQVLLPLLEKLGVKTDELSEKFDQFTAKFDRFEQVQTAATNLSQFGDSIGGAIGQVVQLLGPVGTLSLALTAVRLAASLAGPAIGIIGGIVGIVGAPVLIAVAAVAALAGAFIYAYNNIQPFREAIDGLREQLGPIGDAIGAAFGPLGAFVTENGPLIIEFIRNLAEQGIAFLVTQIQSAQPFFDSLGNFFGALGNFLGALGGVGSAAAEKIFNEVLIPALRGLGDALGVLQPLIQPFQNFLSFLADNAPTLGEALAPLTKTLNDAATILNFLADMLRKVQDQINSLPPGLLQSIFGAAAATNPAFNALNGAANAGRQNVAFDPNNPGGVGFGLPAGGNIISVNVQTGPITGEGDENRLAETIALLIQQSVNRVEAPVPAGQPGLVPQGGLGIASQ